jgi:hypothetical protein
MIPSRRKTDRIREINRRIEKAAGDKELQTLNAELQSALSEHALRVDNKVTATVLKWPDFPKDRRKQGNH